MKADERDFLASLFSSLASQLSDAGNRASKCNFVGAVMAIGILLRLVKHLESLARNVSDPATVMRDAEGG